MYLILSSLLTDSQRNLFTNLCSPFSINNTNYYYPLFSSHGPSAFTSSEQKWNLNISQFSSVSFNSIIIGTNQQYIDDFVALAYTISGNGPIYKIILRENFTLGELEDALMAHQHLPVSALILPLISCSYNILNETLQVEPRYSKFLREYDNSIIGFFTQIVVQIFDLRDYAMPVADQNRVYQQVTIGRNKFQIFGSIINQLSINLIEDKSVSPVHLSGQPLLKTSCFLSISLTSSQKAEQQSFDIFSTIIGQLLFSSQIQSLYKDLTEVELQQIWWVGQYLTPKSILTQKNAIQELNIYTEKSILKLAQYIQPTYPNTNKGQVMLMGINNISNAVTYETKSDFFFKNMQFVSHKLFVLVRCFDCNDSTPPYQENLFNTQATVSQLNQLAGYYIYMIFQSKLKRSAFYLGQFQNQTSLQFAYITMQNFNFIQPEIMQVIICSQKDIDLVKIGNYGKLPPVNFKMAIYNQGVIKQANIIVYDSGQFTTSSLFFMNIQVPIEQSYKIIFWCVQNLEFKFSIVAERVLIEDWVYNVQNEGQVGRCRIIVCPSYVDGKYIQNDQIGVSIFYSQQCGTSDDFISTRETMFTVILSGFLIGLLWVTSILIIQHKFQAKN